MRVAGNHNNPINMKRNNSIILAALALAGLMATSTIVRADDPPAPKTPTPPAAADSTPAPKLTPAQRQAQMIKDLGLTGEKVDKFKAIMKEQQEKTAALRQDNATGADRRTKMKEINDAVTAKMKDLLDKDQFEKWQKLTQQQMPGRRGARGQGGPGAGTPPPAASDASKQP